MSVSLRQECKDGSDQTYLTTPGMTLGSLGGSWVVTQDMLVKAAAAAAIALCKL